jgi:hypothetical protein
MMCPRCYKLGYACSKACAIKMARDERARHMASIMAEVNVPKREQMCPMLHKKRPFVPGMLRAEPQNWPTAQDTLKQWTEDTEKGKKKP